MAEAGLASAPAGEAHELDRVPRRFFAAITARDVEAAVACWAPGGVERMPFAEEVTAPDGIRDFLHELLRAFPDYRAEAIETFPAPPDRVIVHFRVTGTFCGGPLRGLQPTGYRWDFDGFDVFHVRDGLITRIDLYFDALDLARRTGALPPAGSLLDRLGTRFVNARTRARRLVARLRRRPGGGP